MNYNLFFSPFIGAIIGYFTNWLAIKMIFKPYEQKKFLGLNVPFTPGLMAKERFRMSNKIGETVSVHLLSDEVLYDEISEKDFSETINFIFDGFLNYLSTNENTLIEEAEIRIGIDYFKYREQFSKISTDSLKNYLNSPVLKEEISKYISEKIKIALQDEQNLKLFENFISQIWNDISLKSHQYVNKLKLDNRVVSDVVKPDSVEKIKNIISDILPELLVRLRIFIESNEKSKVDIELENLLKKIIVDSYGKLVSSLINPEKLYENAKINFLQYISHNQNDILKKINEFIDNKIENEICKIAENIPESGYDHLIETFISFVKKFVNEDILENGLTERINKNYPDLKIKIKIKINQSINNFMETKSEKVIFFVVEKIISEIEKIKIKELSLKIDKLNLTELKQSFELILKKIIKKSGTTILQGFDVKKIVVEKINEMPLSKLEDIVVSVAEKEIKSITIVGGILGFIIGLIPVIFSYCQFK